MKIGRLGLLGASLALLAACATRAPERPEVGKPSPAAPRSPAAKGAERLLPAVPNRLTQPTPAAPAVGRPRGAMQVKPLDVAFRCASLDERHHSAQADVEVKEGRVRYLRARLATPQGGACEFALPDFLQTQRPSVVELKARNGRCTLHMWEQGPKVTLAYSDCEQYCTPSKTMDYILPILYDRRVKRCN
ncbi:hypothetical protein [Niveibacterium terrae]|uniref:hypothetical protein n=1 Tax=Niveibacterium terrae TaxID=3373598 RepID=UPI003A95AD38